MLLLLGIYHKCAESIYFFTLILSSISIFPIRSAFRNGAVILDINDIAVDIIIIADNIDYIMALILI